MSTLLRRLKQLLRRSALDHDLSEELETHRHMTEQRLRDSGMAPADAAAESRRLMGNTTLAREDARAEWLAPWVESVWSDLRYAARHLRAHKGFTFTAAGTLVLATALITSFFTVFNATVLRPWPVPDPHRIITLGAQLAESGEPATLVRADFDYLQQQASSFEGIVALGGGGGRVGARPGPDFHFVPTGWVTAGFFDVLRIPMTAGRGFRADEDMPQSPQNVVVIGAGLWERAFARDPAILGRTIYFNNTPMTVVGVADPRMRGDWPFNAEIWMPMATQAARRGADACCTIVAGRLASGVTRERASSEMAVLIRQLDDAARRKARVVSVTGTRPYEQAGGARRAAPMVLLLGALFLVLLLACVNVSNLQLARALARRRELAIRLAIGAGRGRIVRQLLTETLLLTVTAGLLALWASALLPAAVLRAAGETRSMALTPDATVLAFAVLICAAATIVSGLGPALRGTRDAADFINVQRGAVSVRRPVLRAVLLSTQIALSATLLFSASLLTRGLLHASGSNPGYDIDAVSVAQITLPPGGYDAARSAAFMSTFVDAVKASGFKTVGLAEPLPLQPSRLMMDVRRPQDAPDDVRTVHLRPLSAEAFQVLQIPLVTGRIYSDQPGHYEIVVNETMARTMWPGESAVGQRLIDRSVAREVVGVVRDVQITGLGAIEPVVHFPRLIVDVPRLLIRAQPSDLRLRLPQLLQSIDPRATVAVTPLTDTIRQSLQDSYAGVAISWGLGTLALLLAIVGVFGVFSYVVEERSREIGIRMALGARRSQVLALVFGATRTSVLAGLGVALVLSVVTGFVLRAFLYGLSPLDPLAYAGATIVLALAAMLATAIPVRRATRVDPVVVLRLD